MTESTNNRFYAIGALFLAVGMSVGGYFIGNMMYKSKVATNIATVRGLAEREVKADVGVWNINFSAGEPSLEAAYASANDSKSKIITFLKEAGFTDEEVSAQAFTVYRQENRDNNGSGPVLSVTFQISGAVTVRSERVDEVAKASQNVGDLVGKGVLLTNSFPQYYFTKLNDIKPEMLGEATRNARTAAEQFAKDANAKVGNINSAGQGAFSISARDAGENSGEDVSSIFKRVRVVTTISFYLER